MNLPPLGLALLCVLNPQASSAREWRSELEQLRGQPEQQQVETVNRLVNQKLHFVSDRVLWKQPDYWATPEEALARGQGDCEDFAIAKYFILRALGIPAEKLWLVYAKVRVGAPDSPVKLEHMVLSYTPALHDKALILDNLLGSLYSETQRPDLIPLFRFNTQSIQIKEERYPAALLANWAALLARMRARHEIGLPRVNQPVPRAQRPPLAKPTATRTRLGGSIPASVVSPLD